MLLPVPRSATQKRRPRSTWTIPRRLSECRARLKSSADASAVAPAHIPLFAECTRRQTYGKGTTISAHALRRSSRVSVPLVFRPSASPVTPFGPILLPAGADTCAVRTERKRIVNAQRDTHFRGKGVSGNYSSAVLSPKRLHPYLSNRCLIGRQDEP
jgi:hypothetical protein